MAQIFRLFLPQISGLSVGAQLELTASEDLHVLNRVLRRKAGSSIEILDGQGLTAQATFDPPNQLTLNRLERKPLPSPEIWLILAATQTDKLKLAIQKAVELGVCGLGFFPSKQSQPGARKGLEHFSRLEKTVIEAMRQSGNPHLPKLKVFATLKAALAWHQGKGFFCDEAAHASPLGEVVQKVKDAKVLSFWVGPEGGFLEEERGAMSSSGLLPLRLGSHVLRAETAAIAAATLGVILSMEK